MGVRYLLTFALALSLAGYGAPCLAASDDTPSAEGEPDEPPATDDDETSEESPTENNTDAGAEASEGASPDAGWEATPKTLKLQKKEAKRYEKAQAKRVGDELKAQKRSRKKSGEGMLREDVLYVSDGSVYRGIIIDKQDIYRIRLMGGSVIAIPASNVLRVSREERFAHETGHARQAGFRVGLGGVAGLSYPAEDEYFITTETLEAALTYAPSHSFEVESSVLLKDDGWKGALGFRYFVNPNQSVKGYQLTSVIIGGEKSALGLRLGNGVQWDLTKGFGMYVHHGATFYAQEEGVHVGYHVDIGVQFRR